MPGYTKEQLAAMNADRKQFKWCNKGCKKFWSRRGFESHTRACGQKVIVKLSMPRTPKPKPGDVMIIHPAWERFIDFLVEGAVKQLLEEQAARPMSNDSESSIATAPDAPQRRGRGRKRPTEQTQKPEYETITVDEAIARYGMTREEIMARFEAISARHREQEQRREARRRQRESAVR